MGTQKLKKVPMGTRVLRRVPTWPQCIPRGQGGPKYQKEVQRAPKLLLYIDYTKFYCPKSRYLQQSPFSYLWPDLVKTLENSSTSNIDFSHRIKI